jgi:hypothetical protein
MVTVAVVLAPPTRDVGDSAKVDTFGAVTTSAPVTFVWATVAPILAVWSVASLDVVAVKVAVLLPAATVTEPGTVATELSELSVTVVPPVGALPERVTVPVEEAPPRTVDGDITTE